MKVKSLQKIGRTLLLVGLCIAGNLVHGQTYTFTNAGATGINGPTQLQVTNAYASTNLAGTVTVTGGIQTWSVPVGGTYKIEVWGANGYGVYGGKGAYMSGEFTLTASQVLKILVGQMGGCCSGAGTNQYGGGGGTFVVDAGNTPLIIAGGGGGGSTFYNNVNLASSHNTVADASITTSGKNASGTTNGTGGTAGNGGTTGNTGGGGGGFLTNGSGTQGGLSFLNGGTGGNPTSPTGLGGFGGGGSITGQNNMRAGGGGGYSGGGGCGSSTTVVQIGGGGGSYNSGTNQVNTAAMGTGHGMVVITLFGPCTAPPTAGTASANPTSGICGGANISLALAGNSTGQGQTYQWEESFLPGGPFTPIPGATTTSSTVQATSSLYYRCAVTCNSLTSNSSEVFVNVGAVGGNSSGPSTAICLGGNAGLSVTGHVGSIIQWEFFDNNTTSWVPITGATTASYTVTNLAATTNYRAAVSCSSPAGVAYSSTTTVNVTNPQITEVFPGSRCNSGPVTLAAMAAPGATVKWYAAPTGGTALGSGGAYTTPSIASTTTYYAAASTGNSGNVGMVYSSGGANGSGTATYGLVFDALAPFILNQVTMYPNATTSNTPGTVTIGLYNHATNTLLQSVVVNVNGFPQASGLTPQTVTVNMTIPAGTNYRLAPISFTGVTGLFFHNNNPSPVYPYTLPGVVSITAGTFGGTLYNTIYYYFYNWSVSAGCEGTRVPVNATINGTSSGTGLSTGGTTILNSHPTSTTIDYTDACNDRVATITNNPAALGNTAAIVLTSPTVQTFGGKPYVPRVFDITPTTNGSATVTLYALQSDFNAYNSYVTSNSLGLPLLPIGSFDLPGMANIRITQFHGNALAGTTGPLGLYNSQNSSFITNPTTTWTGQYWAMTFPVTGFSGFFIHTGSTPLVIDIRDISAVNVGNRNRIDWSTVSEHKGDLFELERSAEGENFAKLASINAKGEASAYSYWDENPISGINYYRLKLIHTSGNTSYSKVVSATVRGTAVFTVGAYPNPVTNVLTVKVFGSAGDNATVILTDVTGKLIKSISLADDKAEINMAGLAPGVYLVKYSDSQQSQTIKVNKQ